MLRILANDGMDQAAINHLVSMGHLVIDTHYEPEALKEEIKNFDCLVVRSATKVTKDVIDAAKETGKLKLVVRAGVGIDNIDKPYAEENGVEVRNTPNSSSSAVAELALAHMFALSRFLHISNVTMRNGEWNKKQYKGFEIHGKTLGLVGFGRISRALADKAYSLGMNVIYYDKYGTEFGFENFKCYMDLHEMLGHADFISLHVPFIKELGPVISTDEFDAMKDGVFIVNTARGGVIDEMALLKALDSGKVRAAALDVFEDEPKVKEEIMNHDRISLSPHVGGSTHEAQRRIGIETYETILNFFS